jgi:hypothetical protein
MPANRGLLQIGAPSLSAQFGQSQSEIADSLRRIFEIFPFSGDRDRRLGSIYTANPYRVWIAEYAGAPYQEVAAKARAHLESLADLYVTLAREAELIVIFKEATRLEADFWEMGWRAGQRVQ